MATLRAETQFAMQLCWPCRKITNDVRELIILLMDEREKHTYSLAARYRYSLNKFQPPKKRFKPTQTARESQRQTARDSGDGNLLESRRSRPTTPAFIQKEAIDKEILKLKQTIKALNSQNTRLKTKNISLEEQVRNLKDSLQEIPQRKHLIRTESSATNAKFAGLQKQFDKIKRENSDLKRNIKYARLTELQAENKMNAAELERLRELLREERVVSEGLKQERWEMKEQHKLESSKMQDRIQKLQQENHYLRRNNQTAGNKVRERARSSMQMRNPNSQTMHVLLSKNQQIQSLKKLLEKSQHQYNELRNKHLSQPKQTKDVETQADQKCMKCVELKKSLKSQSTKSRKKIQQLKAQIKQLQQFPKNSIMNAEITPPSVEESDNLRRFITFRLTAIDISLDEATDILQGRGSNTEMTVLDLLEIFTVQPFSILTDRYHQVLVFHLILKDQPYNNESIQVDENKPFPITSIQHNFRTFIGDFTIPSHSQRKQLFKRVAELVTEQKIRILELLEMSNNEDSITFKQHNFLHVMRDIGIDEDCILEMIRAMVVVSLDLDHLDYRQLFDIFVVEDTALVSIVDQKMERSAQERSINPEVVPVDKKNDQEEDVIFMKVDPNPFCSTNLHSRV